MRDSLDGRLSLASGGRLLRDSRGGADGAAASGWRESPAFEALCVLASS